VIEALQVKIDEVEEEIKVVAKKADNSPPGPEKDHLLEEKKQLRDKETALLAKEKQLGDEELLLMEKACTHYFVF
jgi:hypothetical protein